MSIDNVKKFYEVLSQDKEIQQKFIDLNQKYQGQQMDEAKAMSLMEQEALPLAKQLGYEFTIDDLKSYGEEMKQGNMNRELSEEELQAVAGGGGFWENSWCYLLGFGQYGDGTRTIQYGACFFYGIVGASRPL